MSFRAMMRRNGFSIRLPDVSKAKVTGESFRPRAGAMDGRDRHPLAKHVREGRYAVVSTTATSS